MAVKKERGGVSLAAAIKEAYAQGGADYYMEPLVAVDAQGTPVGKVQDGDTVVFCCRRGEREIELTEMFTDSAFSAVQREQRRDLHFVLFTLYHEKFAGMPVAFGPAKLTDTLAQALSEAGKTQLHCAESEKYAHVTFFFNGGNNEPYPGETDIRIPSPTLDNLSISLPNPSYIVVILDSLHSLENIPLGKLKRLISFSLNPIIKFTLSG